VRRLAARGRRRFANEGHWPRKEGLMNRNPNPPSAKQLRYLRNLAEQRGESFAYPHTAAEASAQIERLKGRRRDSAADRRRERLQISRAMADRGDAASVRDTEIVGYGSSARWKVSAG
jgi:hypothetical protein